MIPITEIRFGERVELYCELARPTPRREAVVEFLYYRDDWVFPLLCKRFGFKSEPELAVAIVLLQTATADSTFVQLRGAFRVNNDGSMLDDEDRRITVERRVATPRG